MLRATATGRVAATHRRPCPPRAAFEGLSGLFGGGHHGGGYGFGGGDNVTINEFGGGGGGQGFADMGGDYPDTGGDMDFDVDNS